jgi:hypothetical protein
VACHGTWLALERATVAAAFVRIRSEASMARMIRLDSGRWYARLEEDAQGREYTHLSRADRPEETMRVRLPFGWRILDPIPGRYLVFDSDRAWAGLTRYEENRELGDLTSDELRDLRDGIPDLGGGRRSFRPPKDTVTP